MKWGGTVVGKKIKTEGEYSFSCRGIVQVGESEVILALPLISGWTSPFTFLSSVSSCVKWRIGSWSLIQSGVFQLWYSVFNDDRGGEYGTHREQYRGQVKPTQAQLSCDFAWGAIEIRKCRGSWSLERMLDVYWSFPSLRAWGSLCNWKGGNPAQGVFQFLELHSYLWGFEHIALCLQEVSVVLVVLIDSSDLRSGALVMGLALEAKGEDM